MKRACKEARENAMGGKGGTDGGTRRKDARSEKRRTPPSGGKGAPVWRLTLGALYAAFFALAGNVPVLSAIQLIPGVPITLQVFLVAMMGLTLGLRGGLTSLGAVWILTFCGLR